MRIWEFAVRRWQFTLVVFALLVAIGWTAFREIPRSEDPIFPIPVVSIVAVYPGADPVDMERLVVDPIEDAISELDDLKTIDSRADDGLATLRIEFSWDTDPERKYDEVIRELNALSSQLPTGMLPLEIHKGSAGLVNIVQVALVSETASYRTLEKLAEDLKETLETVPGVREAETWAFPEPEVRVAVDLGRLAAAGVTLDQLSRAIAAENRSVPGGAVDLGQRKFNLQTTGSYADPEAIAATVIAAADGRVVRVRDVASVGWDTAEERHLGRFNGARAVFVTANQKDAQNVFAVRDAIYERLAAFEARLPPDVTLERGFDQSRNVGARLERLGIDFAIAVSLVLLTLLPLGLRAGLVVMISIPLSLAIGMALLYFSGFSLNQLSIAGFVLALGLLVDDSIVVVENIARYLRAGYQRAEAAIAATNQIALAVLGCTATLALAFLPLLFLPEGAGAFIRVLPAAVLYTILASLFVSLTIIPFLASRLLASGPQAAQGNRILGGLMRLIHAVYAPALRRALAWPRATLIAALAVFVASLALVPRIGTSLFPTADIPQFLVTIEAPLGASLDATDEALRFVEDELAATGAVRYSFANLGRGNPRVYYNVQPREVGANVAEVFAEFAVFDPQTTPAVIEALRARFAGYPGARIVLKNFENGPPIEAPIAIRIRGPDLATLRELAAQVEAVIASTTGTRDVHNPLRLQRTDLDLGIDTDKIALAGLTTDEVERAIRLAVAGLTVGQLREPDGDEYPITIRLPMQGRQTLDALDQIDLATRSGTVLPLRQLTNPQFETAPSLIQRHDRERVVTVSAYPQAGYNTARLTATIRDRLDALELPAGYRLEDAGEAEARAESFAGLGTAVLVAIFGILAVLVLEFGSFRSTLIVAGVIPLGIVGALVALWLTGYTLSFTASIGLIALIGIEIKNSILLVDFTNQLRAQGVPLDRAIEEAGEIRFLPILLTSATAIGGLMPLAVQGSGMYSPLAIVIIGGLVSSTLLARLVTPVMYKLLPPTVDASIHRDEASGRSELATAGAAQ
ncbi:MAG TPA: efflux RND transporter permease subunit [Steroidobacteraceae bacterium]|nr:efflux RND transporter permease subunit [Steroidobacteraceae bacterium]